MLAHPAVYESAIARNVAVVAERRFFIFAVDCVREA